MIKGLIGIGLGAGVMYLLDPQNGSERRTQLRSKLGGALPKTREAVHAKADAVEVAAQELTAKVDEKAAEVISAVPLPTEGGSGEGGSGEGASAEGGQAEGAQAQEGEGGGEEKSEGA